MLIELKFGNKPLAINGKPSIMVGELANLPDVLTTLRDAVIQGELDSDLATLSAQRRRGRKKDGKPTGATTSTTTPVIGGGASPGNAAKALFMRNGK